MQEVMQYMKIMFASLGCDKNLVDTENMLGILNDKGFEFTDDETQADVIVVNTCCFIGDAKQESINTILEMAQHKEDAVCKALIVTGCLAHRYKDEIIKEIPEVDAFLGTTSYDKIAEVVTSVLEGKGFNVVDDANRLPIVKEKRIITTPGYFEYLKIAEGCDKHCTYCIIPKVRGNFRSYPVEYLVEQAKHLVHNGAKELILVAQETTLYGTDLYGKKSLPMLIHELAKIEDLKWIRIQYCYPEEINDELIEAIKNEPKVCHYLDMPIQHCNKTILKRMNRHGDRETLTALIKKIREKIPNVTLRTTLITGFPGETEEQFEELCEFVKEIRFERLGCFAYSPEEGTPAEKFEDQVPLKDRERRAEIIMEEQMIISDSLNEAALDSEVEVVCEGFDRYAECYYGRSQADAPEIDGKIFFLSEDKVRVGEYVKVKIDDTMDYDLIGSKM